MLVQYDSILDEARAVRSHVSVFDVSHMGRLDVSGPEAGPLLDRVLSADASDQRIGKARYALVCNESGGVIDACIVIRTGVHRFLLTPNASNTEDVADWLSRWGRDTADVRLEDTTAASGMIAVQGPSAEALLNSMADESIGGVRPFSYFETTIAGVECLAARTGYTGEDGFKLVCLSSEAERLWSALTDAGAAPCGLGARDVLRLEAGLPLHGKDMDVTVNPYEASLGKFVRPNREGYVAGEAL